MKTSWLLTGTAIVAASGVAYAQVSFPLYTSLTGNEIIQDESNATSAFFTTNQVVGYANGTPGQGQGSALVGGNFDSNLFQRGTSIANVTTGPTFVADRWFAWSGASTNLTGSQDTTAGDFSTTTGTALKIQRTGTGVVQSCVGQDVITPNSYRFAGHIAEFDLHIVAGAGFSAASSNAQLYIVYGTGTTEGAAKMAYTVNTGGGGTPGWANGTIAASPLVPISATQHKYTVAASIPAKVSSSPVTEIGVAVCWTPVGGSPSNDYLAISQAQLMVNDQNTTASTKVLVDSNSARAFDRLLFDVDAVNQLAYYWEQDEPASTNPGAAAIYAPCYATGSTAATCQFQFPQRMIAVPTLSYTQGTIVATLGTSNASEAVTAAAIATNGATNVNANVTLTSSSLSTGVVGFLQAGNSTGGGKIKFSAEP